MLIRRRRLEIRLPLFAVATTATDLDSGGAVEERRRRRSRFVRS